VGARLGRLVWPGMVLAGLALGAAVWAAWPEPTTRIVRLPYGEALPKTPYDAVPAKKAAPVKRVVAAAARKQRTQPVVAEQPEEDAGRVLAAVEPDTSSGPAPVPSQLELDPTYVQESPEELGAEPLPGASVTPAPPPVAG
jgi:hypothetical protein